MKCKMLGCNSESKTHLRLCKKHYLRLYTIAHSKKRAKPGTKCEKYYCDKPAARLFKTIEHGFLETGGFYCEEHHTAAVKSLFGGKIKLHKRVMNGYMVLSNKSDHPLSTQKGLVAEHRYVVYEDQCGVCFHCFWCGKDLEWKTANIDHLDENKLNNERSNLVTSCIDCNRARGGMLKFVDRMREDAVPEFFAQILKYRARVRK